MAGKLRITLFATLFSVGAALAAGAPKAPTYILNGYNLSGIRGVNAAELETKLKDRPGARITQADIHADTMIVEKELEARHIKGRLFTTLAEKKGRVWIIFDVLNTDLPIRQLEGQSFQGAAHISDSVLAAASGLKKGDQLSQEKLAAAGRAIKATYAKAMPGKKVALKLKMQTRRGKTTLTWIIGEPK